MASPWIKITHELPDKPEIVRMAGMLGIDQDAVTGKCIRVWIWADQNSLNGADIEVQDSFLDRLTHCPGFAAAFRQVGWLLVRNGRLVIPNFDRHNGQSAKTRALDQTRKAKLRTNVRSENGNQTESERPTSTLPLISESDLGEGTGEGLLPSEQEVVDAVSSGGVPEAFALLVYNDWLDMGGKNAMGRDISPKDLVGHVRKRWRYEQVDWRSGSHKGLSTVKKAKRAGPTQSEVNDYARDKGDGALSYAVSYWDFWEERGWKINGKSIDWRVYFSKMWANKRGK